MRRRLFLRGFAASLAASSAAAAIGGCGSSPTSPPTSSETILVIGAGIAGLAAARDLTARGFTVIVVEGRDRIGGRIFTDRSWPGTPVDLGASWLHGSTENPVAALAKDLGLATFESDYQDDRLFGPDGAALTAVDEAQMDDRFAALLAALDALREERQTKGEPDLSLAEAIGLVSKDLGLSEPERQRLDFSIVTEIEHEHAADVAELSLFSWDAGERFDGPDVLLPDGYDAIVASLAEGLDIRLETVVETISITDDGVKIATSDGEITGTRAVVTLPLGVLKSGSVAFEPALPETKLSAIGRLGSGVLNKLFMRFDEAFWTSKNPEFLHHVDAQKGHFAEFLSLPEVTGAPVLVGFNAGAYGAASEDASDEDLVLEAMILLRYIFGFRMPDPIAWQVTRWGQDPFARGSHSHLGPGATLDDLDALAAPVGDRLFFAGEATSREHAATVHGAYLSGLREARRIAELVGGD